MPNEIRTRIFILLPIPKTLPQFYAILDVVDELERTSGGVTRTDYYTAKLWGQWFDQLQGKRVEDDLVLLISDDVAALNDPHLESHLAQIKLDAQIALGEDIVWITTQVVHRIAAHDYVK